MTTETKANTSKALEPFKGVRDVLAEYPKDRFIPLLPTTYVGSSPLFVPAPTLVTVDPRDERDVYKTPGSRDGDELVCFHASTLQRIANAAGIDFDPSMSAHRHDRTKEPWVCEQIVGGYYIDSLGATRPISSGWTTHDLRDGSPRANLLTRQSPKALDVARQFICEQCSTRATSRAIRRALQLQSSYKKSELLITEQVDGKTVTRPKPLVALRFRLDETDPDVKKALIDRATGARGRVFGEQPALPEPTGVPGVGGRDELEDIEGQVIDADAREAEPNEPDVVEPEPEPVAAAAPTDRAKAIAAHVEQIRGELKSQDGRPWSKAAREKAPSEPQVGLVAGQITRALGAEKLLTPDAKKRIRRAILAFLFGAFTDYSELTSDRCSAVIDWARDFPAEVHELVAHLVATDAELVSVRDALAQQPELLAKGAA